MEPSGKIISDPLRCGLRLGKVKVRGWFHQEKAGLLGKFCGSALAVLRANFFPPDTLKLCTITFIFTTGVTFSFWNHRFQDGFCVFPIDRIVPLMLKYYKNSDQK
jgi:hypothetical protein